MKAEDHLKAFQEHKEAIFEWTLRIKNLKNVQRTVGVHVSRGIVELLSTYLHEKSLISIGAQINHAWFKSEKVLKRLPEFTNKDHIVKEIIQLELLSEDLTYGTPKSVEEIKKAISLFKKIEQEINALRGIKNEHEE